MHEAKQKDSQLMNKESGEIEKLKRQHQDIFVEVYYFQ